MFTHRFRDQLQTRIPTPVTVSAQSAFVPCPLFSAFSPAQQTQVQEIYRVAAERTREQLRQRRARLPQFSRN